MSDGPFLSVKGTEECNWPETDVWSLRLCLCSREVGVEGVAQGWTILGWVSGREGATGIGSKRGCCGIVFPKDSNASAVVDVTGDRGPFS